MLLIRLPANCRILVAKVLTSQKLYIDFSTPRWVATPNSCLAQGSTVYEKDGSLFNFLSLVYI